MKRIICAIFGHKYERVGSDYVGYYPKVTQTNYYKCKRCGNIKKVSFFMLG